MATVIEIVADFLRAEGYDGLANGDAECGCFLDDLAPCGEMSDECQAGHRATVNGEAVCLHNGESHADSTD